MAFDVFSDQWAAAWQRTLNESAPYRRAAADWLGSVALIMNADRSAGIPEQRHVFLDLAQGECRAARVATPDDLANATFVLEADPGVWRELLSGNGSPILALLAGKLRLARGSLMALLPYAGAAKELMSVATTVEARFPGTA